MKETVNVNIGSQAFILDRDAFSLLSGYLDDIRRRLTESQEETMAEIEARIAEILREKITSPMRVIDSSVVREVMSQMGSPDEFGECTDQTVPCGPLRLYRSRKDRAIAGVCGGLAAYFGGDSILYRLITLLLILFGGISIWVYIILWIVIPEEPQRKFQMKR